MPPGPPSARALARETVLEDQYLSSCGWFRLSIAFHRVGRPFLGDSILQCALVVLEARGTAIHTRRRGPNLWHANMGVE